MSLVSLKSLNQEEKRCFLNLISILICADGVIEEHEKDEIYQFAKDLSIPSSEIEEILVVTFDLNKNRTQNRLVESASDLKSISKDDTISFIFSLLIEVAYADAKLSPSENDILSKIREIFEIGDGEYSKIVEKYAPKSVPQEKMSQETQAKQQDKQPSEPKTGQTSQQTGQQVNSEQSDKSEQSQIQSQIQSQVQHEIDKKEKFKAQMKKLKDFWL